jgi:AGZA family xanthine/uracil permease-like MFS transporter
MATQEPLDYDPNQPYRWFRSGDVNGFLGLMVDNLSVMSFVAIILLGTGYPASIVFGKMFPGTALGVMFGDLVYTWMGYRLAKETGKDVTAMPLGLDTPSSIGVALAVLVPAYLKFHAAGMSPEEAGQMGWYVGMATMVNIGIIKLVCSFFGSWLQKTIPQAGLLGSLAGIGLALIGLLPMLELLQQPIVGMVALAIVLYTLTAGIKLPKKIPGVAAAVCCGTVLYYALAYFHIAGELPDLSKLSLSGGFPLPTLDFIKGYKESLVYLPVAIPFALLTVIGGVNVTESARVGGDDFNTQKILVTEALATLLAGLCGGVAQSTPYIGQPAYKAMGSRCGYTLMTGLFIGLGGILGYISMIVQLIPTPILAPILIFVAVDIAAQAYLACPAYHAQAVAFAHIPTLARMVNIELDKFAFWAHVPAEQLQKLLLDPGQISEYQVIVALGNGFILTGMLWGAFLAELIDHRVKSAAGYLLVCAGLTFFGIIHSPYSDGAMYSSLFELQAKPLMIRELFTTAYLAMAGIFYLLSFTKESQEEFTPGEVSHG